MVILFTKLSNSCNQNVQKNFRPSNYNTFFQNTEDKILFFLEKSWNNFTINGKICKKKKYNFGPKKDFTLGDVTDFFLSLTYQCVWGPGKAGKNAICWSLVVSGKSVDKNSCDAVASCSLFFAPAGNELVEIKNFSFLHRKFWKISFGRINLGTFNSNWSVPVRCHPLVWTENPKFDHASEECRTRIEWSLFVTAIWPKIYFKSWIWISPRRFFTLRLVLVWTINTLT